MQTQIPRDVEELNKITKDKNLMRLIIKAILGKKESIIKNLIKTRNLNPSVIDKIAEELEKIDNNLCEEALESSKALDEVIKRIKKNILKKHIGEYL